MEPIFLCIHCSSAIQRIVIDGVITCPSCNFGGFDNFIPMVAVSSSGITLSGHLCPGLKAFQLSGGRGKPYIDFKGIICCHNDNDVPIQYCPFCGLKLHDE